MPSSGCIEFGATELTVGVSPPAVGAASRSASHRSHGNGEVAK
jgi:hypothetical protein